jgi:hypothetical protein
MFGKVPVFPRRFYLCDEHRTSDDLDYPPDGG